MKLHEIVGYLPYGLKCVDTFDDDPEIHTVLSIDVGGKMQVETSMGVEWVDIDNKYFKPILKTELSEEEEAAYSRYHGYTTPSGKINVKHLNVDLAVESIQYLYSIHYDIHGLVKRGLAIEKT